MTQYQAMEHARRGREAGHIDRVRASPSPILYSYSTHICGDGETTSTWDLDISNNDKRLVVIGLSYRNGIVATSVKINGVSCTLFCTKNPGWDVCVEIWTIAEASLPTVGTYEVEVISSGITYTHNFVATCWNDVLRIGDWDREIAFNGGSPIITVATEPGDVVLDFVGLQSQYILTPESSQIIISNDSTINSAAMSYKKALSTSVTIEWSFGPEYYAHIGIVLKRLNNAGPTIKLLSTSTGNAPNTSGGQWTHDTTYDGTFSNRIMIVLLGFGTAGADLTSVTYNGDAMTNLGLEASANAHAYVYYLVNPDIGNYNVVFSSPGAIWVVYASVMLCGVNQSTPLVHGGSAGNNLSTNSVSFTLDAEDAMMAVLGYWDNGEFASANSGQDEIYVGNVDGAWKGMMHWKKGTGSTSIGYSNLDHDSALSGAHIHAA
jgi:hypothetical protein